MRGMKFKTKKYLYTHVYNILHSNLSVHELSANCSSSSPLQKNCSQSILLVVISSHIFSNAQNIMASLNSLCVYAEAAAQWCLSFCLYLCCKVHYSWCKSFCINQRIKVSLNTAQRLKRVEEMLGFHPHLDIQHN
jgi:hypothetical protein